MLCLLNSTVVDPRFQTGPAIGQYYTRDSGLYTHQSHGTIWPLDSGVAILDPIDNCKTT